MIEHSLYASQGHLIMLITRLWNKSECAWVPDPIHDHIPFKHVHYDAHETVIELHQAIAQSNSTIHVIIQVIYFNMPFHHQIASYQQMQLNTQTAVHHHISIPRILLANNMRTQTIGNSVNIYVTINPTLRAQLLSQVIQNANFNE